MTRPRQRVTIVTDLQYGSTGKGLLCGYLARRDPAITAAVTAWAPNAGHTFIDAMGRKFVHRQQANSIASPAVREIILGPGSVIDVVTLAAEIESCRDLIKRGVRIYAHANAAVLRDRHVVEEQALLRIGSTQKGASAAVIDKMRRDVSSAILAETLSIELDEIGVTVLDPERYSHELMQHAEILVEGHQGFSLSVHHGMWPYTTSRDTSTSAILAERLGSYSMACTTAATPTLSCFMSMMRNFRLWPPPRWRTVMWPCRFRPAVFLSGAVSDFSGLPFVISSKVEDVIPRRPGDVGL